MLRFERHVVDRLVTTDDPGRRRDIVTFVDGALAAMPEHLRASIAAASIALGAWAGVRRPPAPAGAGRADPLVHALDTSPVPQIRQYVRLFRSLVLFAEQELA